MALLCLILDTVQRLVSNIQTTSSSVFNKLRQIIYLCNCIRIKKGKPNLNRYLYIVFDRKSFIGNIVDPRISVIFLLEESKEI